MAEPIAIISFAYPIAVGAYSIYKDVRDAEDAVNDLRFHLGLFCDTLAALEGLLSDNPRLATLTSARQVEESIKATRGGIVKLEEEVKKCSIDTPKEHPRAQAVIKQLAGPFKKATKQLAYAFQKDTIQKLDKIVADLQSQLTLALLTLLLGTTLVNNADTAAILTTTTSIPGQISELGSALGKQLSAHISDELARYGPQLPPNSDPTPRAKHVSPFQSRASDNMAITADSEHGAHGLGPVPADELNLPLALFCSCQTHIKQHADRAPFWSAFLFRSFTETVGHDEKCPHRNGGTSKNTIAMLASSFFLGIIVQVRASMTVTRTASSLSISPTLTFKNTVAGSPAFDVIHSLGNPSEVGDESDFLQGIRNAVRLLGDLFSKGKASPADFDDNGNSLLHILFTAMGQRTVARKFHHNPMAMVEFQKLVVFLYKAFKKSGISVNETNKDGCTPFDLFVARLIISLRCTDETMPLNNLLIRLGAEFAERPFRLLQAYAGTGPDLRDCFKLWKYSRFIATQMDLLDPARGLQDSRGDLLNLAVIRRDMEAVDQLLRGPEGFKQPLELFDKFGYTPVHQAVGWPAGLSRILDAFPHLTDTPPPTGSLGARPIHFACCLGCDETAVLLLAKDCLLDCPGGHAFLLAVQCGHEDVSIRMIAAVVDRRSRLWQLAQQHLPQEKLARVPADRVLDGEATFIAQELENAGVAIPDPLHPTSLATSYITVYHALLSLSIESSMQLNTAEKLYTAGFRDINYPNKDGKSPLACLEDDSPLSNWFISKGATRVDIGEGSTSDIVDAV